MPQTVRISVRNLVEFILRSGDLDNRNTGNIDPEAMQKGSRIHRKIQKRMGSTYRAEVSLKTTVDYGDLQLQVEGRADGIDELDLVVVDEIKGTLRDLSLFHKAHPPHLAQAMCYAYIYAKDNDLEQILVQMTYVNLETEEVKRFQEQFDFGELERWFLDIVNQYEPWARFGIEWKQQRDASIKQVEFPYSYREGQKELVTSVYKAILRKRNLFIQAPTGVGKTLATIFPSVKAIGEGLAERIFYLTAKTITRTVAEQAFQLLQEQGLSFKAITLTAKDKACIHGKANCNPDYCSHAYGHYDRINDALYDVITNHGQMDRDTLLHYAEKHRVCPFELTLDVSLWADVIICDYNYIFDPNAYLRRFFGDSVKGEFIFLIDEAHNLVERGREMYSATLIKEEIMAFRRLVKEKDTKLASKLQDVNKQLLSLKKECDEYLELSSITHIILKLLQVFSELERFLEEYEDFEERELVLEFYFMIRNFLNMYELTDSNYVTYAEQNDEGQFQLRLFCVNPATNLASYMENSVSTIFFSATLLPIHYYKKLLSTKEDEYAIYAHSTFDPSNRLLLLGDDVTTKYTRRSPHMYENYARYILTIATQKKGNYMVFFPSYKFLTEVHSALAEMIHFPVISYDNEVYKNPSYTELDSKYEEECIDQRIHESRTSSGNQKRMIGETEIEIVIQNQYMGEEAREIFLEMFEEDREHSLVALCVMGGIFSEGIDLVSDKLIGAIIVGTGLPQVCNDREIIKRFFDKQNLPGFDYAYRYIGMNKVLQSAGRVIRTETDRGIIALLDERFTHQQYLEIFPREWQDYYQVSIENMKELLRIFWSKLVSEQVH